MDGLVALKSLLVVSCGEVGTEGVGREGDGTEGDGTEGDGRDGREGDGREGDEREGDEREREVHAGIYKYIFCQGGDDGWGSHFSHTY